MKKTIFIIITTIFCSTLATPALGANLKDAFNNPLKTVAGSTGAGYDVTDEKTGTSGIESLISTIITAVLSFLGVIFLILMIYGGFLWMTAAGNEEQVKKSGQLITAAIIGLIIVISAYAISYFVMSNLRTMS